MRGDHDIYIFEDDQNYYVRPKVAMVTRNGKVSIRNLTGYPVTVKFPNGPVALGSCTINSGAHRILSLDQTADGVYEYSAVVKIAPGVAVPALAGSWPKIIVDP